MEEGKKRVLSPSNNTGGKPSKRINNFVPMTIKQKHSKMSPSKQNVTIAHPITMLKSHKQVSTNSFDRQDTLGSSSVVTL